MFGGFPSWMESQALSWDGTKIAFSRGKVFPQELWMMNADGSQARRIAAVNRHTTNGWVAWSPDDRKLAYIRFVYEPGHFDGEGVLGILDLESGASEDLLEHASPESSVAWTRNNRLIYSFREPRPRIY